MGGASLAIDEHDPGRVVLRRAGGGGILPGGYLLPALLLITVVSLAPAVAILATRGQPALWLLAAVFGAAAVLLGVLCWRLARIVWFDGHAQDISFVREGDWIRVRAPRSMGGDALIAASRFRARAAPVAAAFHRPALWTWWLVITDGGVGIAPASLAGLWLPWPLSVRFVGPPEYDSRTAAREAGDTIVAVIDGFVVRVTGADRGSAAVAAAPSSVVPLAGVADLTPDEVMPDSVIPQRMLRSPAPLSAVDRVAEPDPLATAAGGTLRGAVPEAARSVAPAPDDDHLAAPRIAEPQATTPEPIAAWWATADAVAPAPRQLDEAELPNDWLGATAASFEPLDRVVSEIRGSEVDVTAWRGDRVAWAISLGTGSGDAEIHDASAALLDSEYTAVRIVTQRRGATTLTAAVVWLDGAGGQLGASRLEPADTLAVGPGGVLAVHASGRTAVVTQFDPGRALAVRRWHVPVPDEVWRLQGGFFDADVRAEPFWRAEGPTVRLGVVLRDGVRRLGEFDLELPAEVPASGSRVVRFSHGREQPSAG